MALDVATTPDRPSTSVDADPFRRGSSRPERSSLGESDAEAGPQERVAISGNTRPLPLTVEPVAPSLRLAASTGRG